MMTFLKTVAKFPNLLGKVCSARALSLPQSLKKHHRDCGAIEFIYSKV